MRAKSYHILVCLIALCTMIPFSALASLRVTFFDTGDGAALLQADGKTMLFDAGATNDAVKLLTYLDDFDIQKIDLMASTFMQENSAGRLNAILDRYKPGMLWLPGTEGQASDTIIAKAQSWGATVASPSSGDQTNIGKAKVSVVSFSGNGTVPYLVLRVEYEGQSFLFMPGADGLGEGTLMDIGSDLHADVISFGGDKVPSQSILGSTSPIWAILGSESSPDELASLTASGIHTLQPVKDGTVTFTMDGKTLVTDYEAFGTVTKSSVNMRKEATTKAGRASTLTKGSVVGIIGTIIGDEGLWYHIEADNKVGYVRGDLVKEISTEEAEKLLSEATPKPNRSNNGANSGDSGDDVSEEDTVSCH